MKLRLSVKLVLAGLGLLALTVYILACTAFSPDDKQVLYPSFDPSSGTVGLALYDRETRRSDMFFLPTTHASDTNEAGINMIRGQWLPDGHHILMAWALSKGEEGNALNLALMPWGGTRTPLRLFRLPGIKDAATLLQFPLCLAGDRLLFFRDKTAVRLDLKSGAITEHEFAGTNQDFMLFPAPDGRQVFYFENHGVFGRLDPENFNRTPLMTITNEFIEDTFFAYDWNGKTVAGVESSGGTNRVVVIKEGQTVFSRPLGPDLNEATFGNALFSSKGDRIWASYQKPVGTNTTAYGLMEIPLSDAPIREISLIPSAPREKDSAAMFFQFGMSHDGKTAALASTYLAAGENAVKPEDYALFFVDLANAKHKVTKVALTLPKKQ